MDLEISKLIFNKLPLFDEDKSLVCLCCSVELESTSKTNKMHVPESNHIQVSLAQMNQFSPCDFHKENQKN